MMLQKIGVLSTMAAILLLVAACSASPKIENIGQAFDLVIDHLENSSFDGDNCLKLVMEQSEEAGYQGGPSVWSKSEFTYGGTTELFSIIRRFDRPGFHADYGMDWYVYPDGRIEAQHKYPPC